MWLTFTFFCHSLSLVRFGHDKRFVKRDNLFVGESFVFIYV